MESFIDWLESQKYRNEELRKKNRRELGRAAGLIGLTPSPEHTLGNDDIAAAMYNYRYPRDARDARGADVMAQNYENEKNAALAESFDALKKQNAKNESLGRSSLKAERNESMGWLKGSEQHRAQLEASIADYDRQIAKLQAEIAMSEAGDPMYDLAVMRMIMNDDNSLMNDIRNRIGKKIDQEFQTKQKKADQEFQHNENELNRENTLEVAKLNKEEQKAAQKRDLENAFASAQQLYEFALGDLEANPDDPKLKREVEKAKELYRQAAAKAEKMDDFNRRIGTSTDDGDSKPLWDEASVAYKVKGQSGLKDLIDRDIKDPRLKAAVLRDLEKTYHITEKDLGYSGAEAKINEDKAKAAAELEKKVKAAVKPYGKGDDGKKARDKAFDALSDSVKAKVVKGYKDGEYVIKRKGK